MDFSISGMIKDIKTGFYWKLVVVYGSPYEDGKQKFLDELYSVMSRWQGPTMIAGDFNLIRFASDKSNAVITYRWAKAFNEWIHKLALVEVSPSNIRYTWTNKQECSILARIRIFVLTDWELAFPLVRVKGLDRYPSDHNPLLIDTGDNVFFRKKIVWV
jgi:endonuclease/exonuclease/phosphatase family metal-dependent hydrolase